MVRTKKAAVNARRLKRLKKQKKLPLDATPWEELSKNIKDKFKSKIKTQEKQRNKNQLLASEKYVNSNQENELMCQEANRCLSKEVLPKNFVSTNEIKTEHWTSFGSTHLKLEHDSEERPNISINTTSSNIDGQQSLSEKQSPKHQGKKKKKKSKLINKTKTEHCPSFDSALSKLELDSKEKQNFCINTTTSNIDGQESLLEKQLPKHQGKKKKKKSKLLSPISDEKSELPILPKTKKQEEMRLQRKKVFEQKRLMRRKELGILLLPKNIENRLLRLRKALRKKKLPPEEIKSIMRKERSKAQDEFRKSNSSQICYNCREPGHVLANCPSKDDNTISICIKCGSSEHKYTACKKQVDGFPFANCFICKNKGHISRNCPNNEHGIYPKGGKCNLCDSINHLRKDCPTLKKNKKSPITLYTIDNGTSIDDEVMDVELSAKKLKSKEPKVVTF